VITNGWGLSIGATPQPTLNIQVAGTNAILSWPATYFGYSLQTSTNLLDTNSWTIVNPGPVYVGGQNVVTNPVTPTGGFFRLTK
jgi:hypothetical protein